MAIITFCADAYVSQPKGADILAGAVELTKMAMNEMTTGRRAEGYSEKNEAFKQSLLSYASEMANIDKSFCDVTTKQGFDMALNTISRFSEVYFSVIKRAVEIVNSKTEIQSAFNFIEMLSIAEGDSINYLIEENAPVKFEANGYSNNRTRFQYAFNDNITMLPENHEASVAMDLYQASAMGWDFGKQIAKIAIAQRVAIQKEAIDAVFNTANVLTSAFILSTTTKSTYIELAEKLQAYNNAPVLAYGTKSAFAKMSDSLDAKLLYGGAGQELVKTGMVLDVYGVPSIVLDQAISTDGNYALQVASDKILLASANDKLVKCLMEGTVNILADDGKANSLKLKNYKVQTSWKTKVITNKAHGIATI